MNGVEGKLIVVRDATESTLPDNGDAAVLATTIFVGHRTATGQRPFILRGLAQSTDTVAVGVSSNGTPLLENPEVPVDASTRSWEIAAEIHSPIDGAPLQFRVRDQSGQVADHGSFDLGPEPVEAPIGIASNVARESLAYAAGISDRVVQASSFALIEAGVDIAAWIGALDPQLVKLTDLVFLRADDDQRITLQIAELDRKHKAFEKQLRFESAKARLMPSAIQERRTQYLQRELALVLQSAQLTDEDSRLLAEARQNPRSSVYQKQDHTVRMALPAGMTRRGRFSERSGMRGRVSGAPVGVRQVGWQTRTASQASLVGLLHSILGHPSRIGVLFDERLRFRPAGTVRGEHLYTLSLDAGEEVQLKQTSETIHKTTLQELFDKEKEQTIQFSSTWSTDASMGFDETRSRSEAWNVGGGLDASAGGGKIPVTGGGNLNGGYNASSATENSEQFAAGTAYEIATKAVSRMRSQHKTEMEIQDQTTVGYGSVRTLHNKGNLRPRRVDFYKLYRKELVTFERHDARLCLRLPVPDPPQAVRQAFLRNLLTIDPANEELYGLASPGQETESVQLLTLAIETLPSVAPPSYFQTREDTVNLKTEGSQPIPNSHVLVEAPRVRMTSFTDELRLWWQAPDPTVWEAEEGLDEIRAGISVIPTFSSLGNDLHWKLPFHAGTANGVGLLGTKYNHHIAPWRFHLTHEIKLEIRSKWRPNDSESEAYFQQRSQRRQELIDAFSVDKVYAFRDIARSDYLGEVVARAMRENFAFNSPLRGDDPHQLKERFALEHAFVENAPHWATDEGNAAYEALRTRLQELPVPVPLSDILIPELTASHAMVYIPIRHGAERDVLRALPEFGDELVASVASDFEHMREEKFGATAAAAQLPSPESVVGPVPPQATPLGRLDWDHAWERAQKKFQVLAQWSDLIPTDGVDCETVLGITSAADETKADRARRGEVLT